MSNSIVRGLQNSITEDRASVLPLEELEVIFGVTVLEGNKQEGRKLSEEHMREQDE